MEEGRRREDASAAVLEKGHGKKIPTHEKHQQNQHKNSHNNLIKTSSTSSRSSRTSNLKKISKKETTEVTGLSCRVGTWYSNENTEI